MTVAELIADLQRLHGDPDLRGVRLKVIINDYQDGKKQRRAYGRIHRIGLDGDQALVEANVYYDE